MADAGVTPAVAKIPVWVLIRYTITIFIRRILNFALLALLFGGTALWLQAAFWNELLASDLTTTATSMSGMWRIHVVNIAGVFLLYGVALYVVFEEDRNRTISVLGSYLGGARFVPSMFFVAIIVLLVVGAGSILLVVPGMILGILLCVAIPARVAERTGIFNAIRRSWMLTKGNFWQLFGLIALVGVAVMVLTHLVTLPMAMSLTEFELMIPKPGETIPNLGAVMPNPFAGIPYPGIVIPVIGGAMFLLYVPMMIVTVVAYLALIRAEQGMSTEQIADAFT